MSNLTQIEQNVSVRDVACLFYIFYFCTYSVIIPYYYFFLFQILYLNRKENSTEIIV